MRLPLSWHTLLLQLSVFVRLDCLGEEERAVVTMRLGTCYEIPFKDYIHWATAASR